MKEIALPTRARLTSELIPDLALTHGRAVWVLETLGFTSGVGDERFNHYIKSLRRLGIPFKRGELGLNEGRRARYSYNHTMELAVCLKLRIYGTLPDPVAEGLIEFRKQLYRLYRRAYLEYASGIGAETTVAGSGRAGFVMSGLYLDLRLRYAGGRCLGFGPPRALSPFEALRIFAAAEDPARALLPFNLSMLAVRLVECAERSLQRPLRQDRQVSQSLPLRSAG